MISDANPVLDNVPRFCLLYFVDTNVATIGRMQNTDNKFIPEILDRLDHLLRDINPYADSFRNMRETWDAERIAAASENPPRVARGVTLQFIRDPLRDQRRYNLPVGNEIAAVFIGNDGNPPESLDVVVYDRNLNPNVNIRKIAFSSQHVDPMLYPLFFPHGEQG